MTIGAKKTDTRSEAEAEKAEAASVLPRLRAHRDSLELQGGAVATGERRHWTRLAIVGVAAAAATIYALYNSGGDSPPVLAWIVAIALGAVTAGLGYQWEREQAARRRDQEDLSAKMKQIGRRIDSAERTLRR
jgi:hypothetical protein